VRIVVDTNVLLNAVLPNASNYGLFEGIIDGSFALCVTNEILSEYAEVFGRFYTPAIADNFLTALLYSPFVERVDAYFHWLAITADPDDDKFVDCAVAANADYIITNDQHFNVLKNRTFPNIPVVQPDVFRSSL